MKPVYLGDSKISSAERNAVMNSGSTELTAEKLRLLAQACIDRHEEFSRWIKPRMTPDYARRVRLLRCDEGWSYRTIAGVAYLELGADWQPINNQLAGLALCDAAASLLSEDPNAWPWQAGQA